MEDDLIDDTEVDVEDLIDSMWDEVPLKDSFDDED